MILLRKLPSPLLALVEHRSLTAYQNSTEGLNPDLAVIPCQNIAMPSSLTATVSRCPLALGTMGWGIGSPHPVEAEREGVED